MSKGRKRLLIGMLIVAIGFIVLGIIDTQIIQATTTPQERADNPLVGGIPFLLIFGILAIGSFSIGRSRSSSAAEVQRQIDTKRAELAKHHAVIAT